MSSSSPTPDKQPDHDNLPVNRVPSKESGTIAEPARQEQEQEPSAHGLAFWLVFFAVCLSCFLSAFEATSVATALPTIIDALHGEQFTWIGSAYTLSSTAFLPLSGGLAQIFGRKSVVLIALGFFGAGSAICGAAQSMNMLIVGRTIQGVGGGGILSLTEIIVADLVPLRERGKYVGLIGSVWAIASVTGPPIGGVLANAGQWRWLFYLNIPLTGLAMGVVVFFLHLHTPRDSFKEKMARMDWTGNFIVIASTTAVIIALTWGGVQYSWQSYHVLVPLVLGLVGLIVFMFYEHLYAKEAVVPFDLLQNRTGLAGYITTFLHGIISSAVFYYLPTYFQASRGDSPTKSGIDIFGTAFLVAPAAIICGASVGISGRYVPQNILGWVLIVIGQGLLSMLKASTSKAESVGLQIIGAIGFGLLFPATNFTVLAPLPVSKNAPALALFTFVRQFGITFGITIGSTILQNQLTKKLPADFIARFPKGVEVSYAIIPQIKNLPEPLQTMVKVAFAQSIRVIWLVGVGLGGLGLIIALFLQEIKLHTERDEFSYDASKVKPKQPDVEKQAAV